MHIFILTSHNGGLTSEIRLKKVQGKKKQKAQIAEDKRKAEAKDEEPKPAFEKEDTADGGGGDLLSSKDQDVIF